jgi:hypothetical protein
MSKPQIKKRIKNIDECKNGGIDSEIGDVEYACQPDKHREI